ncbi:MAG: S8 family serine peptidase [Pirellulales bacterium]|nr:S8 family serine peptidase [Pirellulales bacterium]
MKRRNWVGRRQGASRRKQVGFLGAAKQRKRKGFTFERLEDRLVFSAQPLQIATASFSSSTPEGAAAILAREMQWNIIQALAASNIQATSSITGSEYGVLSLPNDPLFASQWHLLNTGQEVGSAEFPPLYGVAGQDINVVPAWNMGYTGEGVIVAVIDSGVQLTHPDLLGNISPTLRYNAITGTSNPNPQLFNPGEAHGTAVAGLIAATWNNLGSQVLDEDGNPVFDVNGNPVYSGGGAGVAPNATIVPIRAIATGSTDETIINAFQYALENGVHITNNSWGPFPPRLAVPEDPTIMQLMRDSVIFGRNGLGMINVFSSGNSAGPSYSVGFGDVGNYDSTSYAPLPNSRYTIAVTGVDHDGLYRNEDGSFTTYPEAGASVLIAAPTGSNVAQDIADDTGQGSGLWTADLTGEYGYNALPLPSGLDPDRDLLGDPNYTSRFNGTSGAAPIATGVIALMLEANPNLTYRDVQEILVRSARQNAQFETPSSGGGLASQNTWQTNQIGPFRNPDAYIHAAPPDPVLAITDPLADPTQGGSPDSTAIWTPGRNDFGRMDGHFEPQPELFTNSSGYTVSQGYGVYGDQIGYGHGVIDAELAVKLAEQWHSLGENLDPLTEETFTTFVLQGLGNIPAAEKMAGNFMLVPGGIGGQGGFIDYWDEYFADPPDPFDPAEPGDWPVNTRGANYVAFSVPPDEAINVEWVEVKVDISGPASALDFLRIMLVSPDGTQSELNHYFYEPSFNPTGLQESSAPFGSIDPDGNIGTGGSFVWTFSTNRNWGESTNTSVIMNAMTGEPMVGPAPFGSPTAQPMFRDWELHIENWSGDDFSFDGLEIVWHGKSIATDGWTAADDTLYSAYDPNWLGIARATRIQGFVGIDENADNQFNYNRYIQEVNPGADPLAMRASDFTRTLDYTDTNNNGMYDPSFDIINQETFAENVVVELYRIDRTTGLPEATAIDKFLTGADGNYYFDVDPSYEYEIRISDPLNRPKLEDLDTPSGYLQDYKQVWRVTPDWYFAPDRDNIGTVTDNPGEIFYGLNDANGDGVMTEGPMPFMDYIPVGASSAASIPMAVRNINFLLKEVALPQEFDATGTVYSDLNGNGIFDGNDAPMPNVFVYQDVNRNGLPDATEQRVLTDANGVYLLTIPADHVDTYAVGVIRPNGDWNFTDAGHDGVEDVFAGPGSPAQNINFFLQPPGGENPNGFGNGTIQGVIFNDLDGDHHQDAGELGLVGFRVFLDADYNGAWDASETSVFTSSNGSYFFNNITPGVHRVDMVIPDEGTPAALWRMTSVTGQAVNDPAVGFKDVDLVPAGAITGIAFGLDNLADFDFGDLPDSYSTLLATNGPRHFVVPGFRLGNSVDGEVNGIPTPGATGEGLAGDNDDGVSIISNSGILKDGENTLRVTVAGVGGLLTGWMDFNADGHFDESERLSWTLGGTPLGGEADLNPGTYDLKVTIPAGAVDGPIASRFRWGEEGLTFVGAASVGEVEDYFFGLNYVFGDYNRNGTVDQADYNVWRSTVGQAVAPYAGADGNGDGVINQADYDVWRAHFGETLPPPGAGSMLTEGSGSGSGAETGGTTLAMASAASQPNSGEPGAVGGQQSLVTYGPSVASGTSGEVNSVGGGATLTTEGFEPAAAISEFNRTVGESSTSSVQLAGGQAFVGLVYSDTEIEASQFTFSRDTTSEVVAQAPSTNLLLLDLAWGEMDESFEVAVDDSIFGGSESEENISDLALVAVLNEDSDWWNSL